MTSVPSPTPWSTGLPLSVFVFAMSAVTLIAIGDVLADIHPVVAVLVNVVAVVGALPTFLLWRQREVWRWVAWGVAAAVPVAWGVLLLG
ncbi:DUF2537 domain-containing protein [Rhodococcus sp. SJ-3]|uniref:DUF2537 domain-containing protein n=1 Tax=Rhodococcus sp. SJ-3 TaxID=3454628 RepID=UPI003F7A5363